MLQRHQKRLQAMIDKDKDEKRIEQILTKDKFLDVLASKLSEKMSISAALTQDPARGPGRVDSTREGWHPGMDYARPAGDLTAYRTPAGSHMTMMQQPPQPNFIDDDDMAKVEGNKLPRSYRFLIAFSWLRGHLPSFCGFCRLGCVRPIVLSSSVVRPQQIPHL